MDQNGDAPMPPPAPAGSAGLPPLVWAAGLIVIVTALIALAQAI